MATIKDVVKYRKALRFNISNKEREVQALEKKLDSARRGLDSLQRDLKYELRNDYTTEEILGPGEYRAEFKEYTDHDGPVMVYMDSYFIDIEEDGYSMILGNQQFESQCLRELEAILAEYARDEGECYIELAENNPQ